MDGISLKRQKEFDVLKCIICQRDKTIKLYSTENGRMQIIKAAEIRQDEIYERLQNINPATIKYHCDNDCYKRYTMQSLLNKMKKSQITTLTVDEENQKRKFEQEIIQPNIMQKRSQIDQRSPPTQKVDIFKQPCVCCGNLKNKGNYEKFRISESERAQKFLQAVVYFQDDTYTRTCDLQSVDSVFGADIYCHKNCIRSYILNYDREINKKKGNMNLQKNSLYLKICCVILILNYMRVKVLHYQI